MWICTWKKNSRLNFEPKNDNRKLSLLYYCKAFDTVSNEVLWKNMMDMGFPQHIVQLIKAFYENQTATVKTPYGISDFFKLDKASDRVAYYPHVYSISSLNK